MANKGKFVADSAAIRRLLQSEEMQNLTLSYAQRYGSGDELKPFIGFDRAKTLVYEDSRSDRSNH